jgi:DNA topoisomerase-1
MPPKKASNVDSNINRVVGKKITPVKKVQKEDKVLVHDKVDKVDKVDETDELDEDKSINIVKNKKTVKEKNMLDNVKPFVGKKGGYILVIVESPGKISKLESILGKGYKVEASFGSIIDLHPNRLSVDVDNNFEPEYFVLTGKEKFKDKTKVVNDLRKKASEASEVIIASDKDREGEFIAWSYQLILGLKDPKRITFTAIEKKPVMDSIKNPGKINMKMVESQKARRIEDRLVGFKISPELNNVMGTKNLSAGRVQSVVCRLICDKEEEITSFFEKEESSYFKFVGNFKTDQDIMLRSELYSDISKKNGKQILNKKDIISNKSDKVNEVNEVNEVSEVSEVDEFDEFDEVDEGDIEKKIDTKKQIVHMTGYQQALDLMKIISESKFTIGSNDVKRANRNSPPPHTTASAQQECSTKLGFGVKRTMNALQNLYEGGWTTYLRTDSTQLSDECLKQCEKYIVENYIEGSHQRKNYSDSKGNDDHSQEAHEAIRPVNLSKCSVEIGGKIGADEVKVYDLIWKRTIASQMKSAEIDRYIIEILISKKSNYQFLSSIEDIVFPGFLQAYGIGVHGQPLDNIDKNFQIKVPKKGEILEVVDVKCSQDYLKPPMRYSEAGLIGKMKKLSIGRPATYAESINTIQKRNYVEISDVKGIEKESKVIHWNPNGTKSLKFVEEIKKIKLGNEKKKFVPTSLGLEANRILVKNFSDIMEYKFTSDMEKQLDQIAEGKIKWTGVLNEFWNCLKPLLTDIKKEKKAGNELGIHPDTGTTIT